jgi:ADP-ribosyl-[dinitrogen reductase] hydrolase
VTPTDSRVDRIEGVLLGAACGDALGVPYELGSAPLEPDEQPRMIGGGLGPYEPGEWSDDTQMAVVIARVAADRGLRDAGALDQIVEGWLGWLGGGASDVGVQTRQVLAAAAQGSDASPVGSAPAGPRTTCTAAPVAAPATGR